MADGLLDPWPLQIVACHDATRAYLGPPGFHVRSNAGEIVPGVKVDKIERMCAVSLDSLDRLFDVTY